MARTVEGAALTSQHRQRQLALRAAVIRDLTLLWPLWTLDNFESFDQFIAATVPLIRSRHRDSAGVAANYFQTFRTVEGIGGDAPIRIPDRPPPDKLTVSLRSTGLAGTAKAFQAGKSPQAARQAGFVRMSGAATRHVLDGGRETIMRTAASDSRAQGWQRTTTSDPCAFCAMLASRGPVFKSRQSATAGSVFSQAVMDFRAHDHCSCNAEPVYRGSSPPDEARRFQELWDRSQREAEQSGELRRGTANDRLNAFRRQLNQT